MRYTQSRYLAAHPWAAGLVLAALLATGCQDTPPATDPSVDGGNTADQVVAEGGLEPDTAPPCLPVCEGRICGEDGCGGTCSECPGEMVCDTSLGTCNKKVQIMIPMRDDVHLKTHIILPEGTPPYPTVLLRSPYWDLTAAAVIPWLSGLTDLGYAFIYQAVRGTSGSEGTLTPLKQEFDDGEDMAEWIVAQPWSDGKIGTYGGSYEGFTAMATALRSDHVKVVIPDGFLSHVYGSWPITNNGALSWWLLWWLHLVETGEDTFADMDILTTVTNHRPLTDLDVTLWGAEVPLWRELTPQMESDSSFWSDWSFDNQLQNFCTPVLLLQAATEAEDDMLDTYLSLMQGSCPPEAKANQRFVLGSHAHTGAMSDPFGDNRAARLIRDYLAIFLKDAPDTLAETPSVQVYLQNGGEWVDAASWPPTSSRTELYLDQGASALSGEMNGAPPAQENQGSYTFDPAKDNACGPNYTGYRDYHGAPLEQALDIAGVAEVSLRMKVNRPDTDLFIYLQEVTAGGQYKFITLGKLRLRFRDSLSTPELLPVDQPITVQLPLVAIGYRVAAGSRLILMITSSECGQPENPNTGEAMMSATATQPAEITILTGPTSKSMLSIPTVP